MSWTKLTKTAQRALDILEEEKLKDYINETAQEISQLNKDPAVTGILPEWDKAPIPRIETKENQPPVQWEAVIQEHNTKKVGRHLDLRLADPNTRRAYSWAIRYWPSFGERRLAVRQPDHDMEYMNFEGRIPDGYYGAGTVRIIYRGKADILSADDNHIRFNLYKGNEVNEYLLVKGQGDNWYIIDVTDHREKLPDVPDYKEKYKEISPEEAVQRYLKDPRYIFSRKDDGVQVVVYVKPDGKIKLFSPRDAVSTTTGLIEHTYKVPPYGKLRAPSKWSNSIFRAELFLTDEQGKALPINDIVSFTHNETPVSREMIQKMKLRPRITVFDVVKVKNTYVEKEIPYKEKLRIIEEFTKDIGKVFEPPQYAVTPEEKWDLFTKIKNKLIPESHEGIVIQNLEDIEKPVKAKFKPEWDVYVVGIFESNSPQWKGIYAGGIEYSFEPGGKPIGRVGAGFTLEQRKDMQANPQKYIGRVAKVRAAGQYPDGALRQPVFIGWHPEKGKEILEKVASKMLDPERWFETIVQAPWGEYTKLDLFTYYMQPKVRKAILNELKDKNAIVIQHFTPERKVLKRNIGNEKIEITKSQYDVDNPQDFSYWVERRAVEFHPSFKEKTDRYVIDLDPGSRIEFEQLKEAVRLVRKVIRKLPEVADVEIRFSGGRGFYVIGYLKKPMDITKARERLKQVLKDPTNFPETKFTITTPPKPDQIRLDLSPMKRGGSYRAIYSLNSETGLVSVPVRNLDTFQPEDALPENVVKRMVDVSPIRE